LNTQFSFIIITFNEEIHLPRLLNSISDLDAAIYIVDSGSTDGTLSIAEKAGTTVLQNPFVNHPTQWDFALKNFDIKTPWVICLDADQVVTPELKQRLLNFRDEDHQNINGIYFNRKNFFKGVWIKHGGYSPFYLLKMIRYNVGYSDLNENMDHRFIVPGNIEVWKDGYILEENLKENNISFWIAKHNRYSDLVAQEEVERMLQMRSQTLQPRFWGSPDERTAWLKQLWWKMPRYARPMIYFIYRMFFQLGILDGRIGVIFHFLQAFWFRLIVDVKIDELLKQKQQQSPETTEPAGNGSAMRFVLSFIALFAFLYLFNDWFISAANPKGRYYVPFLADHLNYVRGLRWVLIQSTAGVLRLFGYSAVTNEINLLVPGHGTIQLIYSCLGLGIIVFFSAFVIAYPAKLKPKLLFLVGGIFGIEFLNVIRFVLLELFWDKKEKTGFDHHTIFNIIIYLIIAVALYFWIKRDTPSTHAENKPVDIQ